MDETEAATSPQSMSYHLLTPTEVSSSLGFLNLGDELYVSIRHRSASSTRFIPDDSTLPSTIFNDFEHIKMRVDSVNETWVHGNMGEIVINITDGYILKRIVGTYYEVLGIYRIEKVQRMIDLLG